MSTPFEGPEMGASGENPLTKVAQGKVREIFELDPERLLMVASDRISAYDVVMDQPIPDKGALLTAMSLFWFDSFGDLCPNHLLSVAPSDLPDGIDIAELAGRFMIVRKLQMLPVEFVVRGYLAGSGLKDYQATGTICGIRLPDGLQESDRLPEPICTPATKATSGHDENISQEHAAEIAGKEHFDKAMQYSIEIYKKAGEYALAKGIVLADTKFEFGLLDGEVVLGDEVLTPDSSRFWPPDEIKLGSTPPSFDKQPLRDWLDQSGWNHVPPPPELPAEVIDSTRARYVEAYERLTGASFEDYLSGVRS